MLGYPLVVWDSHPECRRLVLMDIANQAGLRIVIGEISQISQDYQIRESKLLCYVRHVAAMGEKAVMVYHLDCSTKVDCKCFFCTQY